MSITTLQDLFIDQLRDVYSAECQLIPALSELEEAAESGNLRRLLQHHLEETRRHTDRLETIARQRGYELDGDPSKAMKGLISGGSAHIEVAEASATRDFLIVAHCHRIEHYETAAYAVTVALADQLGFQNESDLLNASMEEETHMDQSLTQLAAEELLGRIDIG